jgi:hypothetical protein
VLAVWLAAACSSAPKRPPPLSSSDSAVPLGCAALVDAGTLNGKELSVHGAEPACAADGLECPLPSAGKFDALCGGTVAYAVCASQRWVLRCNDAAAPRDAATDASSARDAAYDAPDASAARDAAHDAADAGGDE